MDMEEKYSYCRTGWEYERAFRCILSRTQRRDQDRIADQEVGMIQARVYWTPGIPGGWVRRYENSIPEAEAALKAYLEKEGMANCRYEIREIEGGEERISIEERMRR